MTCPQGSYFAKIRVSCQTFKMDIEKSFCFLPPIFDHLKSTGQVRNHIFPSEDVKKAFFSIWSEAKISQLSNLQNGHREKLFFLTPHFWLYRSEIIIRRVLEKPFFLYMTSSQGVLFCQNKSELSNLQNGHREKLLFFTPHFWPFKKHWTGQKFIFSHQKSVRKAFFLYMTSSQGVLFCQNKSQFQTFKMDIERSFCFLPPHFWPFKKHWTGQKSYFLTRRVLKSLFSIWPAPRRSYFAKIRVSCQTFKMDIERSFCFLIPHFDHLKTTGQVRNLFPHQKNVLKSLFYLYDLPPGGLFAKIRVSFKPSKWT